MEAVEEEREFFHPHSTRRGEREGQGQGHGKGEGEGNAEREVELVGSEVEKESMDLSLVGDIACVDNWTSDGIRSLGAMV